MIKSVPPVVKCAPKIWKTLSAAQRKHWVSLRNRFIEELIILNQMRSKRPLIVEGDFETVAHNLALEAVWELARQNIELKAASQHSTAKVRRRAK